VLFLTSKRQSREQMGRCSSLIVLAEALQKSQGAAWFGRGKRRERGQQQQFGIGRVGLESGFGDPRRLRGTRGQRLAEGIDPKPAPLTRRVRRDGPSRRGDDSGQKVRLGGSVRRLAAVAQGLSPLRLGEDPHHPVLAQMSQQNVRFFLMSYESGRSPGLADGLQGLSRHRRTAVDLSRAVIGATIECRGILIAVCRNPAGAGDGRFAADPAAATGSFETHVPCKRMSKNKTLLSKYFEDIEIVERYAAGDSGLHPGRGRVGHAGQRSRGSGRRRQAHIRTGANETGTRSERFSKKAGRFTCCSDIAKSVER
jgi:hypothetical protein